LIRLEQHIREVPDFPKQGIRFQDIMPLLQSPDALRETVTRLAAVTAKPDAVVGIESRGFLFGVPLAMHWGIPFVGEEVR
jgi:adenine phosphoribosyltransferase